MLKNAATLPPAAMRRVILLDIVAALFAAALIASYASNLSFQRAVLHETHVALAAELNHLDNRLGKCMETSQ